jgi:hypothetical protein
MTGGTYAPVADRIAGLLLKRIVFAPASVPLDEINPPYGLYLYEACNTPELFMRAVTLPLASEW